MSGFKTGVDNLGQLGHDSSELKGRRKHERIRSDIVDFEPELGLKLGQTKPKMSGMVPADRHTTIPNDSGPIST